LVFNATAPHNPSFWQFYLSKPGYDATQVLTWSDLELVDAKSNVTVDADKKYRIKIALPAERTGDAILFTRWQREDPAGEGFYNCSDIQFEGDGTVDPTLPDNTLTALGYFVSAGFGPVKDGDSVRLRTFDSDGQEIVDMTQSITTANIGSWAVELATRFNLLQQGQWVIGVWDEVTSQYQLDSDNVHVNQIFAPGSQLSYQLSLNKGEPPVEPSPDAWSVDSVYTAGDVVSHNGKQWTAQWWTKGEEPGTTGEWGVWR
ncbi:lytic polysaccharide monooxygenase, partial [Vibrio sp.]|uniref:lytic polysaccharide monooxygenase n=1 Tax=Vibrio sp. TaxID=678 RepID=UPI003D1407DC